MIEQQSPFILASGSMARSRILSDAGLNFKTIPSSFDEEALQNKLAGSSPSFICSQLSFSKAKEVSQKHLGEFVLGSDQVCVFQNKILNKPLDRETARQQLMSLSGERHVLISSASLCRDGEEIWQAEEQAILKMRSLNEEKIALYLDSETPFQSCGSYMFEKQGKFLFEEVQGSFECILGFPWQAFMNMLFQREIIRF